MNITPIEILKGLISRYSPSRNEGDAADYLESILSRTRCTVNRFGNNLFCFFPDYINTRPTLFLNSHIDTVKPADGWTIDPCTPTVMDGKLFGLGSNDAGASVVSIIDLFLNYSRNFVNFNTVLGLSCEEEVGGEKGIRLLLPEINSHGFKIDMALVGEPTSMRPAIAERGLVVLDCESKGVAGHAARNEGVNAIYNAIDAINRLRTFCFPKVSDVLGPIKISVTMIESGTQHNVIPASCKFVADVRTTDAYSNIQTVNILRNLLNDCIVTERSTRVQASVLDGNEPLYKASEAVFGAGFVSPTTSDMSLMYNIPSLKLGPGDSARSHKADEYVFISEIENAISEYVKLLTALDKILGNG